jgi:hypothetical protein
MTAKSLPNWSRNLFRMWVAIGALAPIAAQAQPKPPTDVELKALGETAGELEVCSAYFMVVAACIAPQEPKLAGDYEKKGKTDLRKCFAQVQLKWRL